MNLNIGSGYVGNHKIFSRDDWTNVDISYEEGKPEWHTSKYLKFDIMGRWPIESETIGSIFASHVFEHIEYKMLLTVMRECYRVLIPGRPIRVICPDPRKFITNWTIRNKQFLLDCFGQKDYDYYDYKRLINKGFTDMFFPDRMDHILCSSIDMIMVFLIRVGFSKVTEMAYGNTEFPDCFGFLGDQEYHNTVDNRPNMSWFLEATK